jgi:hypothetical protein
MSAKYKEQLDRAKRYLELWRSVNGGKVHDRPPDYYDDTVITFFLHCYHVKDWIKIEEITPTGSKSKVEEFVNMTRELAICADICNASKHVERRVQDKPRSDADTKMSSGRFISLTLGGGQQTIAIKYTIEMGCGRLDAFALAEKCIAAWDSFTP